MTRKSIPERLDQSVAWTGISDPATAFTARRARPRRYLPTLLIALAMFGLARHIAVADAAWLDGKTIVLIVFAISSTLQLAGPLRRPTLDNPLDERERDEHWRAHAYGLGGVALLAVLGSVLFSLRDYWPTLWQPTTPDDWRTIAFFLITLMLNVGALIASWRMPRPIDEEDDQ